MKASNQKARPESRTEERPAIVFSITNKILVAIIWTLLFSGCTLLQKHPLKSVRFCIIARSVPPGSRIFVAGDGDELGNWKADGVPLEPQADGSWAKTVLLPAGKNFYFKITRGQWRTEALDERGPQGGATELLHILRDTTVTLEFSRWMDLDGGITVLADKDIPADDILGIQYGWRYHTGDDTMWSSADYNDTSWEVVNSRLDLDNLPVSGWRGVGWFRLNLEVDSSLWNKPIALSFRQAGESAVYLDGRLLYLVGNSEGSSKTIQVPLLRRNPVMLLFGPRLHHVIAVRYSVNENGSLPQSRFSSFFAGFQPHLAEFTRAVNTARWDVIRQVFFTTILGALAFLHLMLFVFYPRFRENLFYAFTTIGVGGVWFANNESIYAVEESRAFLMNTISQISQALALISGLLLVYSLVQMKLPKRMILYMIAAAAVAIWGSVGGGTLFKNCSDAVVVLFFIEMVWEVNRSTANRAVGGTILTVGFVIFAASVIYGVLAGYNLVPQITERGDTYIYGAVVLGIAMSVFLSHRFAQTNQDLEIQLGQVRSLSERTLAQERQAREAEIERRLLAADNERKTKELEEARVLQLSMLPKTVPNLPNLDIAVRMETATEVGGDYYDFFVSADNVLTGVIGDATGHGLKAGNMVIATKGLLNALSNENSLDEILRTCNHAIKKMNLHMLTMCLAIIRINKNRLQYSSAGMPPLLIYRKRANQVDELTLKAMPLGAFYDFPYDRTETTISDGDVILMVSDGVIELFNSRQETLGIERVIEHFREVPEKTATEIVKHLFEKCSAWSNGSPPMDDLTAVVIKVRG